MNILAIDTSTDYLSLAVMRGERIAARFHRRSHMRHSSLLVPMIDRLLKKARMKLKNIDCFAISIGPGSFTGLRIGSATIKGFSFALGKPIAAIPTLDVIARNEKSFKGIVCPVLDARKSKVYACLYRSAGKTMKRISKYLLLPADELLEKVRRYDKIVFLGDAMHLIGRVDSKKIDWHPKAEVVAKLGAEYFKAGKLVTAEKLEPMYLYSRECDITGH
ncbi:MAG: tRNA (adenosine(37)-N6)-threonylcarbamoyltransferase complex dimerization subunit type 1 TsaB [Candidatus Omnitrophica bacterium]|nr:tRNA (adenosine(37)-N6)-threonylcarbamoyltransferase complex dimerization subunit type 1 TsaB [Candidatus Omnitrophota bacterium]MDD5436605.1 tRNA (adenosine(37)-N6)-threonylcarbamoyltransferase complex dimerization subunit type 1 TsaB [Candidatus Omnitrophota bacterium]